jgi:hypothetical protein
MTARTTTRILATLAALFVALVVTGLVVGLDTEPSAPALPASCRAVAQLPSYEHATKDDAIRGLVSGTEMLRNLHDAKLSDRDLELECNAYLYHWSTDHPKSV